MENDGLKQIADKLTVDFIDLELINFLNYYSFDENQKHGIFYLDMKLYNKDYKNNRILDEFEPEKYEILDDNYKSSQLNTQIVNLKNNILKRKDEFHLIMTELNKNKDKPLYPKIHFERMMISKSNGNPYYLYAPTGKISYQYIVNSIYIFGSGDKMYLIDLKICDNGIPHFVLHDV